MTDSEPPGSGAADGLPGAPAPGSGGPGVTDPGDELTVAISSPGDGIVVIAVGGELDMLTAPELHREVSGRVPSASLVVLDLDGVRFLGTSGLAALIEIREQAHRSGVELRLACTERRVLRPLGIAGLDHLFDIHDDVPAALNS